MAPEPCRADPLPALPGRRCSGTGYYVYVSDGEPVRAVRERADRPGEWDVMGLVPLREVPAGALKRLGLLV